MTPTAGPQSGEVIALVMAAGVSRRFGDADKRITTLPDGRPLLAATVRSLCQGFQDVRVVIRSEDTPTELCLPQGVPVIRAPNATRGMGSSIADAVHTLEGEQAEAAAICLGDMPWIRVDTLRLLEQEAQEHSIVRPIHQGQPGHPVLFGGAYWRQLCQLTGDQGGRDLIQQYRPLPVDDPGILADLDHPPAP